MKYCPNKGFIYRGYSIIISHNYPGANLKPGHADEILTQKIKQAGQLTISRLYIGPNFHKKHVLYNE
jgi:hypothetical protein